MAKQPLIPGVGIVNQGKAAEWVIPGGGITNDIDGGGPVVLVIAGDTLTHTADNVVLIDPNPTLVIAGDTLSHTVDNVVLDTALTWYVDNEHTGTNAGTQNNPYQSLASLWGGMTSGDIAYIKATDTPYREKLFSSDLFGSTIYCDWTGTGQTRGSSKAKIYGSDALNTWSVYSGSIYSASFSDSSGIFASDIYGGDLYDYGVWYVASNGDITILKKGASAGALASGEFFWNETDTLYVNVGEDPDTGQIEVYQRNQAFEIFTGQLLYGGDFKFAKWGQRNDGCDDWIIEDCEISYNISHGLWARLNYNTGHGEINYCNIHHNMGRGLWFSSKFANGVYTSRYNIIWDNGLSGIFSQGPSNTSAEYLKIYNATVYNNNTLQDANEGGIYLTNITTTEEGANAYDCWLHIANCISTQNYGYDYYAVNATDIHFELETNNAYDSTNGDTVSTSWPTPDVDGDPDFTAPSTGDFSLGTSSDLIDAGYDTVWSGVADIVSYNGEIITNGSGTIVAPGTAVDIGAYESDAATVLVVVGDTLSHTADNLTLVVSAELDIAAGAHGHTADSLVLTQKHTLAVAEAIHAHAVDNLDLNQKHTLAVAGADHAHTVDGLTLTQKHTLSIVESSHAHTADNLVLIAGDTLSISESTHDHVADNLALTQKHTLVVAAATHSHAVDNVDLTQKHLISVDEATHAHTADNLTLGASLALVIASCGHEIRGDNVTLTQKHLLVTQDAAHAHTVDNVVLVPPGSFGVIHDTAISSLTMQRQISSITTERVITSITTQRTISQT